MTETVYLEVTEKVQKLKGKECPFSVSGMFEYLGVSRSGYNAWLKRLPSNQHKRRESVKEKIQDIYDKSYQNYGAPKITMELRKDGDTI